MSVEDMTAILDDAQKSKKHFKWMEEDPESWNMTLKQFHRRCKRQGGSSGKGPTPESFAVFLREGPLKDSKKEYDIKTITSR